MNNKNNARIFFKKWDSDLWILLKWKVQVGEQESNIGDYFKVSKGEIKCGWHQKSDSKWKYVKMTVCDSGKWLGRDNLEGFKNWMSFIILLMPTDI